MSFFNFPRPVEQAAAEQLRGEVRAFLGEWMPKVPPLQRADSWNGFDREFSLELGRRGWLGMTWPKQYGGHERSAYERYVVVEETLAAGAPVAAHWIADRQSGPLLLRFGNDRQKTILPRIASGEVSFCIGMSEPDAGSDLAGVRTRAVPVDGGWVINGTKLWTTNGHRCDYMILFCRTSGTPADRQAGTSQILIDLKNTPGVSIRPIRDLAGQEHFNETSFVDAFVPADALIGTEGQGWSQVMSELAFERSGPERFLSTMTLLIELVRALEGNGSTAAREAVGRLTAHLAVLRRMSRGITVMLEAGENPTLQASIVKDLGALFEQDLPEIGRLLVEIEPDRTTSNNYQAVLAHLMMNAPSFSLRGGTREILRGIIARGLGLR